MGCTCKEFNDEHERYNEFIANAFGECLYSKREIASFIVGMSSLVFWIACQLPQFKKNYEKKSASALSKWFLLEWFLGDALNLVGALLTHQLATQMATATLFIINDSLMITQMTYYTYYGQRTSEEESAQYAQLVEGDEEEEDDRDYDEEDDDDLFSSEDDEQFRRSRNNNNNNMSARLLYAAVIPLYALSVVSNNKVGNSPTVFVSVDNLVDPGDAPGIVTTECGSDDDVDATTKAIGTAIGWISAAVYLNSRIPQILKNQKRQSVEGLSFLMFFCAVMGNTTYGLGVILKDSSWNAIKKALPWLVGSLGTLILDFTILLQFWFYGVDEEDQEDSREMQRAALAEASLRRSPMHGIFGIKAWNTSPFFKPRLAAPRPPPLNLRDTTSLGVLPSEASEDMSMRREPSYSDFEVLNNNNRSRSGSH